MSTRQLPSISSITTGRAPPSPPTASNSLPSFAQTFEHTRSLGSDSRPHFNLPPIHHRPPYLPPPNRQDQPASYRTEPVAAPSRLSPSARTSRKRPYDGAISSEEASSSSSRPAHPPESSLRHTWNGTRDDDPDESSSPKNDEVVVKQEAGADSTPPPSFRQARRLSPARPSPPDPSPSSRPLRREVVLPRVVTVETPQNETRQLKKRRVTISGGSRQHLEADVHSSRPFHIGPLSPAVMGFNVPPDGVGQVRSALSLKHQQKALIEARKAGNPSAGTSGSNTPVTTQPPSTADTIGDPYNGPGPVPSSSRPKIARAGSSTMAPTPSHRPTLLGPSSSFPAQTASIPSNSASNLPSLALAGNSGSSAWLAGPEPSTLLARRRSNQVPGAKQSPVSLTVRTNASFGLAQDPVIRSAPPVSRTMRVPSLHTLGGGGGAAAAQHSTSYLTQPHTSIRRSQFQLQPVVASGSTTSSQGPGFRPSGPPAALPPIASSRRASFVQGQQPYKPPPLQQAPPQVLPRIASSAHIPLTPSTDAFRSLPSAQPPSLLSTQQQQMQDKASFLSPFSNFYDSLSDSRRLKAWLDDQLRKSEALCQGLQAKTEDLDNIIESRVREVREESRREVDDLRSRVQDLENRLVGPAFNLNHSPPPTTRVNDRGGTRASTSARPSPLRVHPQRPLRSPSPATSQPAAATPENHSRPSPVPMRLSEVEASPRGSGSASPRRPRSKTVTEEQPKSSLRRAALQDAMEVDDAAPPAPETQASSSKSPDARETSK